MLTAKNLERIIELESKLRSEYQVQLDAKTTEIETYVQDKEDKQALIDKQLEQIASLSTQIASLSSQIAANKRTEQLNRELHQRCGNLQEEIAAQKTRLKTLQKDLAEERAEIKALKQFDPAKLKKNLDASKKKLVEKTTANDLLQKSLKTSKTEKAELQLKVKELEAKLANFETTEEAQEPEEAAA